MRIHIDAGCTTWINIQAESSDLNATFNGWLFEESDGWWLGMAPQDRYHHKIGRRKDWKMALICALAWIERRLENQTVLNTLGV